MLDEDPVLLGGNNTGNWQARLSAVLGNCFPQIAEILTGSSSEGELHLQLIKAGSRSVCLRVSADGISGFLKLFDGADRMVSYRREKASLLALSDSGLVPEIFAFSDDMCFVVTNWVEIRPNIDSQPRRLASRIGNWLAAFDALAPGEPTTGNWFGYLSKYGSGLDLGRIGAARGVLSDIPLCGRVLSRNDAALHNYLETSDGTLLGCDFEQARMRPRGWDYLLGFGALIERFPTESNEVIEAYSSGFSQSHRGALMVEELNAVARILFCARAVAGRSEPEAALWQ